MQSPTSEHDYEYVSYTMDTTGYNQDKVKTKNYVNPLNNNSYTILNNDSSCITFDDDELRKYRSIILDNNNDILCFSPPNSIPLDNFKDKYPDDAPCIDDVYANEIMEGTMINLFFNKDFSQVDLETEHSEACNGFWSEEQSSSNTKSGSSEACNGFWEIGSRGAIGCNYWYYRTQYLLEEHDTEPVQTEWEEPRKHSTKQQITFRQMFLDAMKTDITADLNTMPILEYLPKNYCYSFVLQHPDNHIVLPISEPHLFLVAVYEIVDTCTVKFVPPHIYESWSVFTDSTIEFPKKYTFTKYKELENIYGSIHSEYSSMGLMLTNIRTGERAALSNPVYEEIKKLRGNNPNLQYQYFCLLRSGQVDKFLEYFPTYKKTFMQFSKQYQDFITNVHQSYFSYYVKKEGIPIAKKYFIHASKIHHQIYLPSISNSKSNDCNTVIFDISGTPIFIPSPQKVVITRKIVKQYFDDMNPSENLYYLHYDKRQVSKKNHEIVQEPVVEDA